MTVLKLSHDSSDSYNYNTTIDDILHNYYVDTARILSNFSFALSLPLQQIDIGSFFILFYRLLLFISNVSCCIILLLLPGISVAAGPTTATHIQVEYKLWQHYLPLVKCFRMWTKLKFACLRILKRRT